MSAMMQACRGMIVTRSRLVRIQRIVTAAAVLVAVLLLAAGGRMIQPAYIQVFYVNAAIDVNIPVPVVDDRRLRLEVMPAPAPTSSESRAPDGRASGAAVFEGRATAERAEGGRGSGRKRVDAGEEDAQLRAFRFDEFG